MTNQQKPEALTLAGAVDHWARCDYGLRGDEMRKAAAELRRLHTENERLAALVDAQQAAACGNTPYDEGPFTLAQQPSPSAQQPFGWIKQHEIDVTNKFGGSISLWRRQYDCDVPVYLAPQPSPTPQADSQPAHQRGTGYPPLPATYYLAGGVVRTWDEGQMRAYVDADRAERTQAADSVLEDAARYDWLFGARTDAQVSSEIGTVFNPLPQDEVISHLQGFYMSKSQVNALVDAARKQGGAT